jgi:hypothetical protein
VRPFNRESASFHFGFQFFVEAFVGGKIDSVHGGLNLLTDPVYCYIAVQVKHNLKDFVLTPKTHCSTICAWLLNLFRQGKTPPCLSAYI